MAAYAYLCTLCDHLSSNHTGTPGSYRCAHCPCERPGSGDTIGLNAREYNEYMARPDTPPNIWAEET